MNLSPEEKFNKNVLKVLERIKEKGLYTKKGNPIMYWVDFSLLNSASNSPSAVEEAAILEKLEEWGVIKILNKGGNWEYE
jgi:hypothetical protein